MAMNSRIREVRLARPESATPHRDAVSSIVFAAAFN
jgi:hypothetical protein